MALCVLGLQLSAQSMSFLNINPDAAASAVANTAVARPADAYAIQNNTAAAALSESRMAVSAGYAIWQPKAIKTGVVSAAGFYRIGEKFAIAADLKNFTEPEYQIASADGRSAGMFAPKEIAAALGVSYKIGDSFSIGLNAKFANSVLAETAKASTVAADVSLAYAKNGFQAGLAVANIGGKVKYGEGDGYALPTIVRAGAAYSIVGLTASAEIDYLLSGGFMAGLGAEYWIVDIVAVRAGFHYGDPEKAIPTYASVGLGAKFSGVSLNATYLLASKTIGGTLMFGLGYSF